MAASRYILEHVSVSDLLHSPETNSHVLSDISTVFIAAIPGLKDPECWFRSKFADTLSPPTIDPRSSALARGISMLVEAFNWIGSRRESDVSDLFGRWAFERVNVPIHVPNSIAVVGRFGGCLS